MASSEIRRTGLVDPHTWIYGTVIVMTAYAVYEPEGDPYRLLAWWHLAVMTLGPLLALAMAHAFAEWYDLQIKLDRPTSGEERRQLLTRNAKYLLVALPPLLLDTALWFAGASAITAANVLLGLGLGSLMAWGWIASTRVHASVARRIVSTLFCGLAGSVVIVLELLLRH